jgi:putative flippase GtrA
VATAGVGSDDAMRARTVDRARFSLLSRFASVGVVNTIVDFALFLLLVGLGLHAVAANLVSTAAGMAVSFAGNRRFVFGATGDRRRELVLFVLVCGAGVWLIQPAVILGVGAALGAGTNLSALLIAPVSKAAAIVVAAVWNFVLYRQLVFRAAPSHQRGTKAS